ncbi:hypothetical protein Tco_0757808 [Tanacetum coccineum]
MDSGSYWLDKVQTSSWRDVRTLAIEEAYTTKYSIHPGTDTMLCGFRLTNRWLSIKKDIASCGSKYLAYLEVEVEYQGSSGLLVRQGSDLQLERCGDYHSSMDVLHLKHGMERNVGYVRFDNQSIERDRLIGIGFCVEFCEVHFVHFW